MAEEDNQHFTILDRDLDHLPPELRWREWMGRVEAMIFAAPEPVGRDVLTGVIGRDCNLDLLIEDIRAELRDRPYDLISVAGGWQHRTRPRFSDIIRKETAGTGKAAYLSQSDLVVLAMIAYMQPITRTELGQISGRDVGRDQIARLRSKGLIGPGPRSPQRGSPYTYVTTLEFLSQFDLQTLDDLPDLEQLTDAGLLETSDLAKENQNDPLADMPLVSDEGDNDY